MYYSTVANTLILTIGSLIATKYYDVVNQFTVPLILLGTITLVMNLGVKNGVKTHEKIVFILSLLSFFWVGYQYTVQDPRDLSLFFTVVVLISNLTVTVSYFKNKIKVKKQRAKVLIKK